MALFERDSEKRIFAILVLISAVLCLAVWNRQGLWVDEVSSLARATGHSLEQPAADANPVLGDFQEPADAVDPVVFRRFIQHENPPALLSRVLRCVLISDTNPPLYYILLHYWTRVFGTGDAGLRSLSILFGLACLPLFWLIGARLGGKPQALYSTLVFAIAPIGLYYSVEGRMYSLMWFESLMLLFFMFHLNDRSSRLFALFTILIGAMGLLTHYYFVFIWLPLIIWGFITPGMTSRMLRFAVLILTLLLILPWYVYVPESFGYWRVTSEWLRQPLNWKEAVVAPFVSGWRLISPYVLGNSQTLIDIAIAVPIVLAVIFRILQRKGSNRGTNLWLWVWLIPACLGPSLQDLLLGTSAASERRYVLGALPAAQLLIADAFMNLRSGWRRFCLMILVAGYIVGIWSLYFSPVREQRHFRELAQTLSSKSRAGDMIIVHSIPQGVLGFAHYMTQPIPMAGWVGQLGQRRVPESIERLVANHSRILLLKIHDLGEPAPEEDWLRAELELVEEQYGRGYDLLIFEDREGK